MSDKRATGSNSIVLRPNLTFNGVKIFSATMVADRERLGEKVTEWIAANATKFIVTEIVVSQSSDASFHMIALSVFYFEDVKSRRPL